MTGDFTLSNGGTLVRTVGDASSLGVAGSATLAGTIKVHFPEDYTPPVGEPLTLCTFGSIGAGDPVLDTTALPAGYAYALENVFDGATSSLALFVNYADTAIGFRLQYGLALDGSEDLLDESGNGIANILYYVFGLGDPAKANIDRSRLPAISAAGDSVTFSYVRPIANGTGLEFSVKTSTDLSDWKTPDELGFDHLPPAETSAAIDAGYQRVTLTFDLLDDHRFYQLMVAEMNAGDLVSRQRRVRARPRADDPSPATSSSGSRFGQ